MLSLDAIDLDMLGTALELHNDPDTFCWLDRRTGEIAFWMEGASDESVEDLDERGVIRTGPVSSDEGYRDMEEFIDGVDDERARERLWSSIATGCPFRRFKDTLEDFPDLRDRWFAFHNRKIQRRAVEWLMDAEIIAREEAERTLGG